MDFTATRKGTSYLQDQRFFTRLALALAALIVLGFLQWALRGFVAPLKTPPLVHLHGVAMLCWLGTLALQSRLAETGKLNVHRMLGWASLGLVCAIVALGIFTARMALAMQRVPPIFTDAYFLALTHVEVAMFATLVAVAIVLRRHTQWHRRLMIGATVIFMEPALGRLLPMPMLGQTGGAWLEAALQVAFLGILARHDATVLGRIHPGTMIAISAVVASHGLIQWLAAMPAVAVFAQAIAHGSGAA